MCVCACACGYGCGSAGSPAKLAFLLRCFPLNPPPEPSPPTARRQELREEFFVAGNKPWEAVEDAGSGTSPDPIAHSGHGSIPELEAAIGLDL